MSIADISRRVELHFWDLAIPAISASPLLQRGIKALYRINRKTIPFRWHIIGTSAGIFGFINGMIIYWFLAR